MIWDRDSLETERLILRRFRRRDVAHLPALLNNWAIARWLARVPYPYGAEDARSWVKLSRSICRSRDGLPLAVVRREPKQLIGGVGVNFKNGEIGYWFGEDYWGRGYATEAVSALTDRSFSRHAVSSLWAAVRPGNDASCKVLEKVGFRRQGTREYTFRDGNVDALFFTLDRSTWQSKA